ncbi:hypothetical protein F0U60_10030 [Archangium minus]|uniref:Immunity MXAN-0049 protein domain-containing protein n=1 Tax=Archangium minus TaxID=83450 RepID=A0ABY9WNL3_9BACT|nr:hypothetical protein F0U61_10000 [Archangium violaceum]WNG44412.1 hypothetical protein F0U60_10030 [Archangium minus]
MNYWVLLPAGGDEGAVLDALPQGSPDSWHFFDGVPLASKFPQGGTMEFSPNFLEQRTVFDFVPHILGMLVVSIKVRQILESLGAEDCEFLPVTILDHKNKVASREHFILNLLNSQDVIDMEKSKYKINRLAKTQIARIQHLVLKQDGIDAKAVIFRARTKMNQYFINQAAHDAFAKEGVTGYMAVPAPGWDGFDVY